MKTCSKCKESKPLESFNKNGRAKDGRHTYCRACHASHYRANIVRHKANVRKSKATYKINVLAELRTRLLTGCVDCGTIDLRVLDFDHVRGSKAGSVMEMVRLGRPLEVIVEEANKCDVRCKNCHAIKTYERIGGSWRDMPT